MVTRILNMDGSSPKFSYLLLLILVGGLSLTTAQDWPPYEYESEKLGNLRGSIASTFSLLPYYQFQGIPYGDVKQNGRFLPPVLKSGKLVPDGETFDATLPGPTCVQHADSRQTVDYGSLARFIDNSGGIHGNGSRPSETRGVSGAEDCLFINVFTRDLPTPENPRRAPVVVFIHGGAFSSGSSNFYEGHRFLEEDVVLVTFNYRLGTLGFFCLDTDEAPGNAAMYDMITALHWIQENIEDFGGDPTSVTLTGQSAGSASVIHLMASPIVTSAPTPLFHKVVAFSGTGGNEWATVTPERATAASLRLAELVGCYNPALPLDTVEVTACMTALTDLELLMDQTMAYELDENRNGRLGFDYASPTIQVNSHPTIPKFLVEEPMKTFGDGRQLQVPLIMGTTRHDGSYPLGVLYNNYLVPNSYHTDPTFLRESLVPHLLQVFGVFDESNAVYDAISKTYLEDKRDSGDFDEMMPGLIDLHSVFFFKADTYRTLQLHAQTVEKSYWYSFDYPGKKSLFGMLFGFNPPPVYGGISHGDDLIYLFGIPFFHNLNEDEMAVSNQLIQYIGNFARTGNPNPDAPDARELVYWPSYDIPQKMFLSVNLTCRALSDYQNGWESVADELVPPPVTTDTPTPSPSSSMPPSQTPPSSMPPSQTPPPPPICPTTEPSSSPPSPAKGPTFKTLFIVLIALTLSGPFMQLS